MKPTTIPIWALLAAWAIVGSATTGLAAVTVTPASGGTNISADKAANAASPAWTTLSSIIIDEVTATKDLRDGGNHQVVLSAPAGWEFNTSGVSVSLTITGNCTAAWLVSVTASNLTFQIAGGTSGAPARDQITISGLQVRAINGAVLPNSGTIYRTGGGAEIKGIVNNSTSFGSLSQVVGSANKLAFTTEPVNTTAGATMANVVVQIQDQFGNSIAQSGTSITLTLHGSTLYSGTNPRTTDANGRATFNDLVIQQAGNNLYFTAAATGLTGATSSTFNVTPAAASKLAFTTSPVTVTAGAASSTITVQRQDTFGNPVTAEANRTVTLSSDSTGTVTFVPASPLTIPSGSSTANFTYTDTKAGTPTITAASTSPSTITSATQQATVNPAAASAVRVETAADGSGTVVPAQSVTPGGVLTVYAISRDANNNFVANVAVDAWSLVNKTGRVSDTNLVAAGDSKSATFTGRGAGTANIRATSGSLTAVDSGTLTVPNVAPVAGTATYQRKRNVDWRLRIANLLTNATDANHDPLALVAVPATSTNGATIVTNATFLLYTPPPSGGNVTDSFEYTVSDGTATASSTVVITIAPDPTGTNYNIVAYGVVDGKPTMTFAGIPGYAYVIQRTTDLTPPPVWTDLLTTNAPAHGLFEFVDAAPPEGSVFYRAINP